MRSFAAMIAACGLAALAAVPETTAQTAGSIVTTPVSLAGPTSQPDLVEMTPANIAAVRKLFYDRGFPVRGLEPYPGQDLDSSISHLQRHLGHEVTGRLTVVDLEQLRRIRPPAIWGAIGYTGTGGHVGVARYPSRAAADESAKAECSGRAHKPCQALSVAADQCISLVHSKRSGGVGRQVIESFWAYGRDPETARRTAMSSCLAGAVLRDNCELRRVVCADGRI